MRDSANDGKISVAHSGAHWLLRFEGEIRFTLSPALNQLLNYAFADPQSEQFLLDLSQVASIDSTNLGVLVRVAQFARERGAPAPIIISPNPSITDLLHGICFEQLFTILPSADYQAEQLTELTPLAADESALLVLVLEAHKRLCALDQKNRDVFQDLVIALELQAGGSTTPK